MNRIDFDGRNIVFYVWIEGRREEKSFEENTRLTLDWYTTSVPIYYFN